MIDNFLPQCGLLVRQRSQVSSEWSTPRSPLDLSVVKTESVEMKLTLMFGHSPQHVSQIPQLLGRLLLLGLPLLGCKFI
jgi:hypothetical protein